MFIPKSMKMTKTRGIPSYRSFRYVSRNSRSNGWDIAKEIAAANNIDVVKFAKIYEPSIFDHHVEIPFENLEKDVNF